MGRFGTWFTGEIIGLWFIWSTYMAIKFMTEAGQHQHAAFSLHGHNGGVGSLIAIPIILSILMTLFWLVFVGSGELD
jgi:hypothetical protein